MWLALTNGIWLRVTVSPLQVLSSRDIAWFHSSLGEPPTSAMKRTCSMCPDAPRRKRNTCSIIELNLEPNLIHGAELNQTLQTQKHSWHQQSQPADSAMYEWEINTSGCMPSRLGNHSVTQCFYGNNKLITKTFWGPYKDIGRRQWQPTPVLLPGKSHGQKEGMATHFSIFARKSQGQRNLSGYNL